MTVLSYTRFPLRLIPTPNHAPRGTLIADQRGRAQHDQGGKQETNGGKLAFIRAVQAFTCHGEYYPAIFLIRLAIRSTPSPVWKKAFIVMRFARNLPVLLNYRSLRSLIFTPNKRPRGTPMQSAQGVRSTTEGEK